MPYFAEGDLHIEHTLQSNLTQATLPHCINRQTIFGSNMETQMFYYSKLKWCEFKERPPFPLSQGYEVMGKLLNLPCTCWLCREKRSLPCLRLCSHQSRWQACDLPHESEGTHGATRLGFWRDAATALGHHPILLAFLRYLPSTLTPQLRCWSVTPLLKKR